MKCPKCGYNSFDHLDSCKKCGKELVSFKQQFGIKSVLFPGQMKPTHDHAEAEIESTEVEEVVAAATVAAGVAAAAPDGPAADFDMPPSGGPDDFGFDFMGESEGEEDLSFDELFEEAPADENVEESLPEPDRPVSPAEGEGDFVFDMDSNESEEPSLPSEEELAEDFGFDIDEAADGEDSATRNEADFDLPSAEDEDFDFVGDEKVLKDAADQASGLEEDPKDPFEVPGSLKDGGIPESTVYVFEPLSIDSTVPTESAWLASENLPPDKRSGTDDFLFEAPAEESGIRPSTDEQLQPAGFLPAEPSAIPIADESAAVTGPHPEPQALTTEEISEIPDFSRPRDAVELSTPGPVSMVGHADPTPLPAELSTEENDLRPTLARRMVAFACDLLLLLIVSLSFIMAAEAVMGTGGEGLWPSTETLIDLSIPYFLVLFSLAFGYFTLFHFLAGQTPGKMLTGLRVETLEGEPLAISQAFLRSVGGLLQLLPIGLGYLIILTSSDRRGWNDQLAGTRLVNLKNLSETPG